MNKREVEELAQAILGATMAAIKRANEAHAADGAKYDRSQEIILRGMSEQILAKAMPTIQARAALAHLDYERVKARAKLCGEMEKALRDVRLQIRGALRVEDVDRVLAKYAALAKGGS